MSQTEKTILGVIDLGTNSARLFLYSLAADGSIEQIDSRKHMIRLGDGLYEQNLISDESLARGVDAFLDFREFLDTYKVTAVRAVATSALRVAHNAGKVVEEIERASGIRLEVISGDKEAQLVARGLLEMEQEVRERVVLIDIGGGSTEVIFCRKAGVQHALSFPMGASRGQQLFLKQVPPDPNGNGLQDLKSCIRDHLAGLPETIQQEFRSCQSCFGSSGSIRAFGRMYRSLQGSQHSKSFSQDFLDGLLQKMLTMDRDEIRTLPELEDRRIDLILSAGIILNEILLYFDIPEVHPSLFALKDGLALELAEQTLQGNPE